MAEGAGISAEEMAQLLRAGANPAAAGGGSGGISPEQMYNAVRGIAPEVPATTLVDYAADAGGSFGRSINRLFLEAPYRATRGLAGLVGAEGAMRPFEETPLAHMTRGEPATEVGRYAGAIGEAAAGALIPYAAAPAIAARAIASPATSTVGRVVQDVAGNIVRAPGAAAAIDAAGAVGSGAAMRYAEDKGAGPLGTSVAGIVGGLAPGAMVARHLAAPPGRVGSDTAVSLARQRADEAARDIAAFEATGVRPYGPAFNQGPVASIGQQVGEMPYIGAPLRNNLDESYAGMAAESRRIAGELSPRGGTPESAGASVVSGIERSTRARLADLPASEVTALGLPDKRPIVPTAVMSEGAVRDATAATPIRAAIGADTATTTRGVTTPPARPLVETLTARSRAEDLTDAQLHMLVRAPSSETSVAAKAEALYERAWRMVPDLLRSNGSRNPNLVPTVNTAAALEGIQGQIANQIAGQSTIVSPLVERLMNIHSNMRLEQIRAIRTEVGRALSGGSDLEQSLSRTQLKSIYAGLSRDMEVALSSLADRAALRTTANGQNHVGPEVARAAAGALRAMRTADRYFRQSAEALDRVAGILKTSNPEAAARRLVQAALDGDKGNIRLFRTAMAGLRPEERAEFGSMIVRAMGAPTPGAKGMAAEHGFSAPKFVTDYRRMSEEARNLVFTPEHQRALENLMRVADRIANVESLKNTSRTATNAINFGAAASLLGGAYAGNIAVPLAIGGTGMVASTLMSSPKYTQWMARYIQLRAAVRDGTDRTAGPMIAHLRSFESSARGNPELWPVYLELLQDMKGDKNGR